MNFDDSGIETESQLKSESANNTPSLYQKKITESKISQVQQQYKNNGAKLASNEKIQSNAHEMAQEQNLRNSHARSFSTRLDSDYSAKKTQPRQSKIGEDDNLNITPSKNSPKKSKTPFSRATRDIKSNYSYVIMLQPDGQPDINLNQDLYGNNNMTNQNVSTNSVKRTKYVKRSDTIQSTHSKQQLSASKKHLSKTNFHATGLTGSKSINNNNNNFLNTSQSLKNISHIAQSQYLEEDSFNDISFFNNINQNLSAMNFSQLHLTHQQQQMQQTQNMSKLQKEFQQQLKQTTGRVQRLFQKKPQNAGVAVNNNNGSAALGINKNNSNSRNRNNETNRSLTKSVSEQKFNQANFKASTIREDMNKTQNHLKHQSIHKAETNVQLQNYLDEKDLSVKNSTINRDCGESQTSKNQPLSSFQTQFQMKYNIQDHSSQLHNIDAMIQQVTPSSSSNPSHTIEDEQFLELESMINNSCNNMGIGLLSSNLEEPKALKQDSMISQFDAITVQKNIDLDTILKFLIAEEEQLNQFSSMIQQGQLLEMQQQLPSIKFQYQYLDLIQSVNCKKERPKYFAQQLQVSLIFANTMIEIFTPSYLQKFSHKLRMVYTNIHQNFLLFIDQILNCCNANPSNSLNYVVLRKLIVKKLKNKIKSKRITLLRQNNEVNLLNLKKICKFMVTNSSSQAQVIGSIEIVNPFSQEFKEIGSEMIEILRVYEKITIHQILERLSKKDEINKTKQQQILNSPTIKRAKSNLKNASPKQSPRTLANHYSPANSSKSLRSGRNSDASNSAKNLDINLAKSAPKRAKLVRPAFDYQKQQLSDTIRKNSTQKTTNSRVAQNQQQYETLGYYNKSEEYVTVDERSSKDLPHNMGTINSENSGQFESNQFSQPQPHKSVFFLPESMAFILSNSIECNNGITNINNNINIYNSPNIDMNQLRKDAKNAKVVGKINTKTGEIQVQQQQQHHLNSAQGLHRNESVPFIKRTTLNANKSQSKQPINNGGNAYQKTQNFLKPNNTSTTSKSSVPNRLNHSSLSQNNSIQRSQMKSRQQVVEPQKTQMSRVSSKLNFQTNNQLNLLDDDDDALDKLDLNQIDLSRQTSINNSTVKSNITTATKQFKSANQSPNKKSISRPMSRQVAQTGKPLIQNKQSFQDPSNFQQKSSMVRAQSRQQLSNSASKKSLITSKSKAKIETTRCDIDTASVSSTPLKQPDYITNTSISLSTEKSYKPLFSANKKNQVTSNLSAKKPLRATVNHSQQITDKKLVPTKNITINSPQQNKTTGKTGIMGKNQEKSFIQKAVQQTKRQIQKEHLMLTSDQLSQLNIQQIGLDVNSINDDDQDDKFYSDHNHPSVNQFSHIPQVQPHTTQNIQQSSRGLPHDKYDDMFDINDNRLDSLLNKMSQEPQSRSGDNGTVSKQDSHSTVTQQVETHTPSNQERRSKIDGDDVEEVSKAVKMLQFGSLLEQHMGSLDLKKEMEKLKQLDEEQKRQKKITLRVNTRESCNYNHSNQQSSNISMNQSINGSFSVQHSIESPTKRILIGEFDEDNQDEDDDLLINPDDDLLLSAETLKHQDSRKHVDIEVFDFADYITQKTGMEDPFPDHQEPDEEALPSKRSTNGGQATTEQAAPANPVDEQLRKNDEENQRLRSMVKIPYLPALDKKEYEKTYTLVLDLDETLIHFECDDEAQDEDEQGYYLIRPGAIKFLNELSKYYELVIFTAAMPDYADWIVDNIDRHRIIKHRLYRQHTTPHEDYAIKDLRNLGRSLERTIIIDNLAENFIHTTPDNGIWVESWYDDMDDTVMEQLIPFLRDIVTSKVDDVRKLLTKSNKENILYRCLEENKDIPTIKELLVSTPSSSYKKRWGLN